MIRRPTIPGLGGPDIYDSTGEATAPRVEGESTLGAGPQPSKGKSQQTVKINTLAGRLEPGDRTGPKGTLVPGKIEKEILTKGTAPGAYSLREMIEASARADNSANTSSKIVPPEGPIQNMEIPKEPLISRRVTAIALAAATAIGGIIYIARQTPTKTTDIVSPITVPLALDPSDAGIPLPEEDSVTTSHQVTPSADQPPGATPSCPTPTTRPAATGSTPKPQRKSGITDVGVRIKPHGDTVDPWSTQRK